MENYFYVAGCVFTEGEPALSKKMQAYVHNKFDIPSIRCCTPKYKVEEFEERMPQWYQSEW